jgi:hypothetical protein
VTQPLRAGTWTIKLGHQICSAVWFLALSLKIPTVAINLYYLRKTLYFSYVDYDCDYNYSLSSIPTWYTIFVGFTLSTFSTIGYITLLVTSILLLIVARRTASRQGGSLRWEGITTVLLTVVVLLISYLPASAKAVASFFKIGISNTLEREVNTLSFLNIMANFFVYSLTVKSFRQFLKLKISELRVLLGRCIQLKAPPPGRAYPTSATVSTMTNVNVQDTSI